MNFEKSMKFKKLCLDLRRKGVLKTDEEIFEVMIDLVRRNFEDFFG